MLVERQGDHDRTLGCRALSPAMAENAPGCALLLFIVLVGGRLRFSSSLLQIWFFGWAETWTNLVNDLSFPSIGPSVCWKRVQKNDSWGQDSLMDFGTALSV